MGTVNFELTPIRNFFYTVVYSEGGYRYINLKIEGKI